MSRLKIIRLFLLWNLLILYTFSGHGAGSLWLIVTWSLRQTKWLLIWKYEKHGTQKMWPFAECHNYCNFIFDPLFSDRSYYLILLVNWLILAHLIFEFSSHIVVMLLPLLNRYQLLENKLRLTYLSFYVHGQFNRFFIHHFFWQFNFSITLK